MKRYQNYWVIKQIKKLLALEAADIVLLCSESNRNGAPYYRPHHNMCFTDGRGDNLIQQLRTRNRVQWWRLKVRVDDITIAARSALWIAGDAWVVKVIS